MNLDKLLDYTEKIKEEIGELELHPDDVRHSFFGLYYSSIYDYYIGKASYRLAEFIGNGDVQFTEKVYPFKITRKDYLKSKIWNCYQEVITET